MSKNYIGAKRKRTNTPAAARKRAVEYRHRPYTVKKAAVKAAEEITELKDLILAEEAEAEETAADEVTAAAEPEVQDVKETIEEPSVPSASEAAGAAAATAAAGGFFARALKSIKGLFSKKETAAQDTGIVSDVKTWLNSPIDPDAEEENSENAAETAQETVSETPAPDFPQEPEELSRETAEEMEAAEEPADSAETPEDSCESVREESLSIEESETEEEESLEESAEETAGAAGEESAEAEETSAEPEAETAEETEESLPEEETSEESTEQQPEESADEAAEGSEEPSAEAAEEISEESESGEEEEAKAEESDEETAAGEAEDESKEVFLNEEEEKSEEETAEELLSESEAPEEIQESEEPQPEPEPALTKKEKKALKKAIRKETRIQLLDEKIDSPRAGLFTMLLLPGRAMTRVASVEKTTLSAPSVLILNVIKWAAVGTFFAMFIEKFINIFNFSFIRLNFTGTAGLAFRFGIFGLVAEYLSYIIIGLFCGLIRKKISTLKLMEVESRSALAIALLFAVGCVLVWKDMLAFAVTAAAAGMVIGFITKGYGLDLTLTIGKNTQLVLVLILVICATLAGFRYFPLAVSGLMEIFKTILHL